MNSNDMVLNRAKAVEYARKHAENPNTIPLGPFWEFEVDCTNFVSQCWNYGGFPETGGWWWTDRMDYSRSWTIVDDFADYMTYSSAIATDDNKAIAVYKWSSNEAQLGDIIQFYNPSSGWHHSAIVTKIQSGEIYYSAHSRHVLDKALSDVYPQQETQIRFICPKYSS